MRFIAGIAGLLIALGIGSGQRVEDHATGPGVKVGDVIPRFSLSDQNGKVQSLASLSGPKGLMLVFFRSADW